MHRDKLKFDDCYVPEPNSGCWLWDKAIGSTGYGHFKINGKLMTAHRVSYAISRNLSVAPDYILHKCDVPFCVNPEHLYAGTKRDNSIDMARRGRQHMQKLSIKDVQAILADNRKHWEIAAEYGVTRRHISKIKSGGTWIHAQNP